MCVRVREEEGRRERGEERELKGQKSYHSATTPPLQVAMAIQ